MILGPVKERTREARVWFDELPVLFDSQERLEYEVRSPNLEGSIVSIAVEIKLMRSPQRMYGLLGVSFIPNETGTLKCIVRSCETSTEWSGANRWTGDRVYVGLPAPYANTVMNVVRSSELKMGSGRLEFSCSAHAEIGSNEVTYAFLAGILIEAVNKRVSADDVLNLAIGTHFDGAPAETDR